MLILLISIGENGSVKYSLVLKIPIVPSLYDSARLFGWFGAVTNLFRYTYDYNVKPYYDDFKSIWDDILGYN